MPLVILSVLTVVWLLTGFYSQTVLRSGIHQALRSVAGISTDTVLRPEDEPFSGLYDNMLRVWEIEELLQMQAEKFIAPAGGVKKGLRLEGKYNGISLLPVLKLGFKRHYGGWGVYGKGADGDGSCWYYSIDEAQWIRNEDWIFQLLT